MASRISMFALIVVAVTCATCRADSLEQTLLAKEKAFIAAIQAKDAEKLKSMLAPEAYTVVPELGRQRGEQILARLASTNLEKYSISDVKVIEVTDEVGILSFKYSWSGNPGKKGEEVGTFYSSSTWVRRDGEWKVIFYQQTPWSE